MEVHSRESVVLRRLIAGGSPSLDAYVQSGGYRAIEMALGQSPGAILETVDSSGLRGRGGAGFPTARKWRAAAREPREPKFLIANADEGDAGAYIDRFILEGDPHGLIEGMLIAAHAIGASRGYIYLRHEYPLAQPILQGAIDDSRRAGYLGRRIRGREFNFDIEVIVGHGSYVCGEETALIRSMESRRPEASARPPYITTMGLGGLPTVTNNVETLANIPWIIEHGSDAYRDLGFSKSRGTKVVSLNSLFVRPGLFEVEFGIPVRQIVEELGGGIRTGTLKGVIIGGPLAGIIPPDMLDTPFGFEELSAIGASVGHGGVIAFDEHTSIVGLMRHIFSFGAYESCGKCTPCRLGARRIEEMLVNALKKDASAHPDWAEFREIVDALKWTSLCGHGVGLAIFANSAVHHYGKEIERCFT
jgi:formate dehydrogenase iron-sulfur subunit